MCSGKHISKAFKVVAAIPAEQLIKAARRQQQSAGKDKPCEQHISWVWMFVVCAKSLQFGAKYLPPSPFAADALAFVKRVANGQNIQHAALSVAGQRAIRQIENRAGILKRELELELGLPA